MGNDGGKYWDKAWLERRYVSEKKTLAEIGREVGVSAATIMRALDAVGIPRRGPKDKNMKQGPSNGNWKGSAALYSACHKRVYKILGRADHCEKCGRKDNGTKYNWANLTGKLDDPDDYMQMCRSCHMRYDANRRKAARLSCNEHRLIT
ncbi:MAG: hypothetical protein WC356_05000 [Candidatus Micrarchaeia archaeon]|jgi:hypothetical protein